MVGQPEVVQSRHQEISTNKSAFRKQFTSISGSAIMPQVKWMRQIRLNYDMGVYRDSRSHYFGIGGLSTTI
jgi:hypothetical protein